MKIIMNTWVACAMIAPLLQTALAGAPMEGKGGQRLGSPGGAGH